MQQVVLKGPRACLPANLSNRWLDILKEQAEASKQEQETDIAELVSAVLVILVHKQGGTEISFTDTELQEYLDAYGLELSFESVSRRTSMDIEPATLNTILTDREVVMMQRPEGSAPRREPKPKPRARHRRRSRR